MIRQLSQVLNYIDSLGESDALSLQSLSWKLAMILTRPSRSADLANYVRSAISQIHSSFLRLTLSTASHQDYQIQ